MQVKNNQETPYMLCGVLIPPGGVAEVDADGYEKMLQVPAFKKVVDAKGIEEVSAQTINTSVNAHANKTNKIK